MHINKQIVNDSLIMVPDKQTMNRFNETVLPMFNSVSNLLKDNKVLKQNRDLLLPKLISGQLDVSELDIATEEMVTA